MKPNNTRGPRPLGRIMGQHFLNSPSAIQKILGAAELDATDTVLEIGPGAGVLTRELLIRAKKVLAIEKDPRLATALREEFAGARNLELVEGDVLKIFAVGARTQTPKLPKAYKIVANIPYYITAQILRLFLEETKTKPSRMVLMIQKEVAERIVAAPPEMSLLALSEQAYGKARIISRVPRGSFVPPPRVDSAILCIDNISDTFFGEHRIRPKDFFEITRRAFSQKRKMLRKSLGIENVYATKRPQELSLEDWTHILAP